jgi:hypothetical protein
MISVNKYRNVVTRVRNEKLARSIHLLNWKRCFSPEPRDVYSADETGLFFKVLPERTLAYKGETCHGGKHSKDRLTVLLCVNSEGSDKQVPIVIGKSRCFKDVKNLPIKYHANSKA